MSMGSMNDGLPVRVADVAAAAERLRGVAAATPLLESDALNELTGGRLLIKAECLQRTGSFKFRGAYNTILALRPPAVVAFSSGNHAQGVALAARLLGIPATIVMPADAPRTKLEGTRALGAEVVTYERLSEDREAIGREIAERTGAVHRPSLRRSADHSRPGHGRAGARRAGGRARGDAGCGHRLLRRRRAGGGLRAGAHPSGAGRRRAFGRTRRIRRHRALACRRPAPRQSAGGALLLRRPAGADARRADLRDQSRLLAGGLAVSDAEVAHAMRLAFRHLKLVIEPGGAVALAAAARRQAAGPRTDHRRGRLGRQRRCGAVHRGAQLGLIGHRPPAIMNARPRRGSAGSSAAPPR